MTKWKCNKPIGLCSCPCYVELANDSLIPHNCILSNLRTSRWERVPDEQEQKTEAELPKLTAEVFDREDCPEWAICAFVGKSGNAFYSSTSNVSITDEGFYWEGSTLKNEASFLQIGGKWDASDWQNSLIERPEKTTLPDWCKVGEWVWLDPEKDPLSIGYMKIEAIDRQTLRLRTGSVDLSTEAIKQARIRPWTFEEAPAVLKVKDLTGVAALAYLSPFGEKYIIAYHYPDEYEKMPLGKTTFTFSAFADIFTQIDGSPCGILEHLNDAGEWVE